MAVLVLSLQTAATKERVEECYRNGLPLFSASLCAFHTVRSLAQQLWADSAGTQLNYFSGSRNIGSFSFMQIAQMDEVSAARLKQGPGFQEEYFSEMCVIALFYC